MKVEITRAQIEAIKSLTDDADSMIGASDRDKYWVKYIKLIDRFLENNGHKRRYK